MEKVSTGSTENTHAVGNLMRGEEVVGKLFGKARDLDAIIQQGQEILDKKNHDEVRVYLVTDRGERTPVATLRKEK